MVSFGECVTSIGNSEACIGTMGPMPRFFNPYPVQRHATD